jgi:antitoxin MazE
VVLALGFDVKLPIGLEKVSDWSWRRCQEPFFKGATPVPDTFACHRRYLEVAMKIRVQKWGNRLALRIPKSFAAEVGLRANGAVERSLVEGALVVRPVTPQPPTLDELLRGITDENIPSEWDTGLAVGKEVL